jgi:hypothetical protein
MKVLMEEAMLMVTQLVLAVAQVVRVVVDLQQITVLETLLLLAHEAQD